MSKLEKRSLKDKRVLFKNDVIIRCFETDSERQSINNDEDQTTTTTNGRERCHHQQQQQLSAAEAAIQRRKPPTSSSVPLLPEENMLHFKIVRDRHPRQLLLQFSVIVGQMYGPKGVMVKANVAGTKIRVLACSKNPVKSSDGQSIKTEYSKTFPLPVAVDPDRVTARVDSLGLLKVEAPILLLKRSSSRDDNDDDDND